VKFSFHPEAEEEFEANITFMINAIQVLDSILPAKSTPQSKTPSPIRPCGLKLSLMSDGA
jgi:hypothetical protein